MTDQEIQISDLANHLLCPVQCHLKGVHLNEVPKFLADTFSETTHAIQSVNDENAAHQL